MKLKEFVQKIKKNPRAGAALVLAVLLPVIVGGIYVVQNLRPQAAEGCEPTDIHTERVSNSAGRVTFNTPCSVRAAIYCAAGKEGIEFFCGEDQTETTTHVIETSDVTLNSNTGYYVLIDTQIEERALTYIPASPTDITYGLDATMINEEIVGLSAEDEAYDPALDVNGDGFINMMDRGYFFIDY